MATIVKSKNKAIVLIKKLILCLLFGATNAASRMNKNPIYNETCRPMFPKRKKASIDQVKKKIPETNGFSDRINFFINKITKG